MQLDVYLSLKFGRMSVTFIFYLFRETFVISDHVTLLSYYLDFHLISVETNKITKKKSLISTIIIIIKSTIKKRKF